MDQRQARHPRPPGKLAGTDLPARVANLERSSVMGIDLSAPVANGPAKNVTGRRRHPQSQGCEKPMLAFGIWRLPLGIPAANKSKLLPRRLEPRPVRTRHSPLAQMLPRLEAMVSRSTGVGLPPVPTRTRKAQSGSRSAWARTGQSSTMVLQVASTLAQ